MEVSGLEDDVRGWLRARGKNRSYRQISLETRYSHVTIQKKVTAYIEKLIRLEELHSELKEI